METNKNDIKNISGTSIILYFIGIPLILFGIITKNIGLILGGIILLPITNEFSKKYLNINFSAFARIIIAIFLGIFINALVTGLNETTPNTSEQEIKTTENKNLDTEFELGMYTIESEEFDYLESKVVRVWKSFNERKMLAELKQGDTVQVVGYDSENNYCEVSIDKVTSGWFSCDWLVKQD